VLLAAQLDFLAPRLIRSSPTIININSSSSALLPCHTRYRIIIFTIQVAVCVHALHYHGGPEYVYDVSGRRVRFSDVVGDFARRQRFTLLCALQLFTVIASNLYAARLGVVCASLSSRVLAGPQLGILPSSFPSYAFWLYLVTALSCTFRVRATRAVP
jgi:hypothetical protein